jgi:subtilisin family serine protease
MKIFIGVAIVQIIIIAWVGIIISGCTEPEVIPKSFHKPKMVQKCNKRPLVVAIIDTGFGYRGLGKEAHLCKFGHKDFSLFPNTTTEYDTKDPVPLDTHGHGTNVAGIIDYYGQQTDTNFCMVILKYYDPKSAGVDNMAASVSAIRYAKNIDADFINYSGGGLYRSEDEAEAVTAFIDNGGIFVAAAGNEYSNIDKHPYYPAMADLRTFIIGGTYPSGEHMKTSNYGESITKWEIGSDVIGFGIRMTGTSQATATATGKLVARIKNDCN